MSRSWTQWKLSRLAGNENQQQTTPQTKKERRGGDGEGKQTKTEEPHQNNKEKGSSKSNITKPTSHC